MFLRGIQRRLGQKHSVRENRLKLGRRLKVEPLEDRRLLSLLGVTPTYPVVTYDALGPLSYDSSAQSLTFQLDATPLVFRQSATSLPRAITAPRDFFISINVDNQGHLIDGGDGSDLVVTGNLDIDGNGVIDYTGTLLTGKVTQFGYSDSGTTTDLFDFRVMPTGGPLASHYAGKDIGITTTAENSTFTGSFATNFAGYTKGTLGSIAASYSSLGGYVYNDGLDDDGIKQAGDAGIAGVSLTLTGTNLAGTAVSATAITDSQGAYSFTQLRPGTYTIGETQPAGWLDGKDTQGTPGTGTVGNDVFTAIVLGAGVNGQNNNFGELPLLPGIGVTKLTNGQHDLNLPAGSDVMWTYAVSNAGNAPLADVSVTDDQGVVPTYVSGDANSNSLLDTGEVWNYTASGLAVAGDYANIATAAGTAYDTTGTVSSTVSGQDTNHYFGVQPGVQIDKLTNGEHTPNVAAGSIVTWTYNVTNTGNVALAGVIVADDQGVTPVYQSGDANADSLLDPGEMWVFMATGTAVATPIFQPFVNIGTVQATDATGTVVAPVTASAADGYVGIAPAIAITKLTDGEHHPNVVAGEEVDWTYIVTNTGNAALAGVIVSDDQGASPSYQSGDANGDGKLDLAETWVFVATGTAIAGTYTNVGTVTSRDATGTVTTLVTASATDGYFGVQPGIAIVKLTNGTDNNAPTGPVVTAGSTVAWMYQVTNTGNVAVAGLTVADSDASVVPAYQSGDADSNGLLDLGETWTYTASAAAILGQYVNTATATGTDATGTVTTALSVSDLDYYFGVQQASIDVEKYVKVSGTCDGRGWSPSWWRDRRDFGGCGYRDCDSFNSVFGVNDPDNPTLQQALERSGDGRAAFGRQAVAALLNAMDSGTGYGYSALQVVDMVRQGYGCHDYNSGRAYFAAKNQLEPNCVPDCGQGSGAGTSYGDDADAAPGVSAPLGSRAKFTYVVTNPGPAALGNVVLTDDNGTPTDAGDDFIPAAVLGCGSYNVGDVNRNNVLEVGETWLYTASTIVATAGQHSNLATVAGTPVDALGNLVGLPVTDADPAYWYGGPAPVTLGSISGSVYSDADDNGVFDLAAGDAGIAGVRVTLTGTDDLGRTVRRTTTTGAEGGYLFDDLRPGTYSVSESQPDDYLDGVNSIGTAGGVVACGDVLRNISLAEGVDAAGYNFGEVAPAKVSGFVWLDVNDNGDVDYGEMAIANVRIALSGTDNHGNAVSLTETTDCHGAYEFANLRPGDYTIVETQPANYLDGIDVIGSQGGTASNDRFDFALTPGTVGVNNNFGERPTTAVQLSEGMTATIGFWNNRNGQALIKSLNGDCNSTALGNWLAANLPNMYGSGCGQSNMAGKTNAQVAKFFQTLFAVKGQKLDAQVMAVALATYVTKSSLAGGTMAARYGFIVNTVGTGAAMYNLGANGAAFGVANNTTLSIAEILNRINARSRKGLLWDTNGNGVISCAESVLRNMGNMVCTDINETGDIG